MPKFWVYYLGEIEVKFKRIHTGWQNFQAQGLSIIEMYSQFYTEEFTEDTVTNLIYCLLHLKAYASSIKIFEKSGLTGPVLSHNIAIACIFTQEYQYGLEILNKYSLTIDSSLLKGYLHYLLHEDLQALKFFSKFRPPSPSPQKKISKNHSFSLLKRPNRMPIHKNISGKSVKTHAKTTSLSTMATTPINCIKNTSNAKKELKPIVKKQFKINHHMVKIPAKVQKKQGFFIDPVFNENLPEKIPFNKSISILPLTFKMQSPNDSFTSLLSVTSLNKLINYFRNTRENPEIAYKLVKNLGFFKQYSKEICLQLINSAEYQFYPQDSVIFYQEEPADSMYVILIGTVSVQELQNNVKTIVNSRYDGETIGEYALTRGQIDKKYCKRSATCFAAEPTHLLKIFFKNYESALGSIFSNESQILKFLMKVPIFQSIPAIELALLSNSLQIQNYKLDEILLKPNKRPKGLYIVFKGRLRATYKKKVLEVPPKYYFGHSSLVGKPKNLECTIISNAAKSEILFITSKSLELLNKETREIVISRCIQYIQYDL